MRHELKTWPAQFEATLSGLKRFEWRRYDREFALGDTLALREYDPKTDRYTGRMCTVKVTYILCPGEFGLPRGFVIMGVRP